MKMDVSNLCRSCMKEVASWEKENFDKRAVEMFNFCTNIKILDEDKLPKQFCYDCIIKIESSYTFITEAQKVNVTLKNIVCRTNTSVIVEPDNYKIIDNVIPKNIPKLTLPECKISATVDNFYEHVLFDNVDDNYEQSVNIISSNQAEVPNINPTMKLNENLEEVVKEKVDMTPVKVVENDNNKKNVCPVCRKSFTSKTWFSKHMEKEHAGHKYTCSHCPKTFSKASQLAYHAASHSEERKFACNTCGKRFKRRKQLAIHARGHADVRPYACDKCSMRFKIKSVLKCHMKTHEEEKQYLCYFCGWSFAQAGNLEVHMRKHTGEKPFSCNECGFRAAVKSNLRRHERRHRGARTYVCTHCQKGFYDASALTRHTRTHTGALPYQCPGCTRAFSDSWKRKTHLMRAHRLALHDIPRMRRNGDTLQPVPA